MRNKVGIALLIGFLLGFLWWVGLRFVTLRDESVHYHANFALYIDGEREPFESFGFYEEVQSCDGDELFNPKARVHMHDRINHVVHAHDAVATWGHFFANIGYTLGNDVLATDTEVYSEKDGDELIFVLNGEEITSVANRTIESEDALVVYVQDRDADMMSPKESMLIDPVVPAKDRYEGLEKDAGEYNGRQDPSTCSGGKPLTFAERLRNAIGVF